MIFLLRTALQFNWAKVCAELYPAAIFSCFGTQKRFRGGLILIFVLGSRSRIHSTMIVKFPLSSDLR